MSPVRPFRRASIALGYVLVFVLILGAALPALAAGASDNAATATPAPIADSFRSVWGVVRTALVSDLEQMPEAGFGYRPTAAVRTYSEQLAHASETLLVACTMAHGDPNPVPEFVPGQPGPAEATLRTKSEVAALVERATKSCDTTLEGLRDADLGATVEFFGRPATKAFLLLLALGHTWHHDGSAVVYLREKGVVPERSAPPADKPAGSR